MKNKKLLSLPLTLLFVASCNEKVSPELKNSSLTSGGTGTTVVPSEYFIKVADSSPTLLNFRLHRTGLGRYNSDCKISSAVPLTNGLYTAEGNASPAIDHDAKVFDISCYYDMEEMGLYNNGFQFDITASANTCEYVGYMPYSFFDRVPGNSSTTYTAVKCTDTTDLQARAFLNANYPASSVKDHLGTTMGCEQYLDIGLARTEGTNIPRSVATDQELCNFDYSLNQTPDEHIEPGKNCDTGTIVINQITLITEADATGTPVTKPTTSVRKVTCGGKVTNCVNGPILQSTKPNNLKEIDYMSTSLNTNFSQTYKYTSLLSKERSSTVQYTNFRSSLANSQIDYRQYSDDTFANVWNTDSNRKKFDPSVMEYYAANRKPGSAINDMIVSDADFIAASVANGYTARPYAADPFMGLSFGSTSATVKNSTDATDRSIFSNRVNPYYVVYCLDAALDIKGRIRIVARDWDRTFTANSSLENISDYIGLSTPNLVSRQDNPVDQEIPGDPGSLNSFNDYYDWDNLIYMQRAPGPYILGTTTYSPEQGFFNRSSNGIFTNGEL